MFSFVSKHPSASLMSRACTWFFWKQSFYLCFWVQAISYEVIKATGTTAAPLRFVQTDLPAKLLAYFLWSNQSNINQIMHPSRYYEMLSDDLGKLLFLLCSTVSSLWELLDSSVGTTLCPSSESKAEMALSASHGCRLFQWLVLVDARSLWL